MDTEGNQSPRLTDLLDRLGPAARDIVVHDQDGPRECLVRRGELLVDPAVAAATQDRLGARLDRVLPGDPARFRLRAADAGHCVEIAADLGVHPNHVHLAAPIMFGTGGDPEDAPLPPAPPAELWDPAVTVALLDTGLDPHPWFAGRPWLSDHGLSPEVLTGDPIADREAGHGTFVAGVLLQHAPGVTIRHHRSLSSAGLTDDLTVAAALRTLRTGRRPDIVVLTAGCRTADDECPPVLAAELARHGDTLVVAAAGNDGGTRPFWPAALPGVIAVAATGPTGALAPFATRGDWVDATAPGVDVLSSFVRAVPDQGVAAGTVTRRYGGARWSGSSFAAPRIAADLARLLRDGATPTQARGTLAPSLAAP
jgi:thermitase